MTKGESEMTEAVLTALVTFLSAVIVALIAGLYSLRNTRREAEASPYEHLMERVKMVEGQLKELEEHNRGLKIENESFEDHIRDTNKRVTNLELQTESYRDYIISAVPWIDGHRDVAKYSPPEPQEWWGFL